MIPLVARLLDYLRRRDIRRPQPDVPLPAYSCLYCDRPYASRDNWPYCSNDCAVRAEAEG